MPVGRHLHVSARGVSQNPQRNQANATPSAPWVSLGFKGWDTRSGTRGCRDSAQPAAVLEVGELFTAQPARAEPFMAAQGVHRVGGFLDLQPTGQAVGLERLNAAAGGNVSDESK